MLGDGAASRECGETADEDAVIGLARHAEAVAEQGAAAQWALRVAGEHRDLQILSAEMLDQLADKRALADAAGEGHDARGLGGGREVREDVAADFTLRRLAQEASQRQTIALSKTRDERLIHGRPHSSYPRSRRCPEWTCPVRRRGRHPWL